MESKSINKNIVGKKIKQIRLSNGWTLKKFSDEISKVIGDNKQIAEGVISRWESGISLPNPKRLKAIAQIANITVEELLYGNYIRYCFDECWQKWINSNHKKIDNFILSEERLEYLEKEKEKIFDDFYNKLVSLNLNNKNDLDTMGEGMFLLSIKTFLASTKLSEALILENLISYIKEEQSKILEQYFKIVDGEKQFKDDYSKLMYEKLKLSTNIYILVLEERLKEIATNYDYN